MYTAIAANHRSAFVEHWFLSQSLPCCCRCPWQPGLSHSLDCSCHSDINLFMLCLSLYVWPVAYKKHARSEQNYCMLILCISCISLKLEYEFTKWYDGIESRSHHYMRYHPFSKITHFSRISHFSRIPHFSRLTHFSRILHFSRIKAVKATQVIVIWWDWVEASSLYEVPYVRAVFWVPGVRPGVHPQTEPRHTHKNTYTNSITN